MSVSGGYKKIVPCPSSPPLRCRRSLELTLLLCRSPCKNLMTSDSLTFLWIAKMEELKLDVDEYEEENGSALARSLDNPWAAVDPLWAPPGQPLGPLWIRSGHPPANPCGGDL
eukprot:TRINITY_DN9540_c0_g2_i6.p2 TRINITY_DN9540_c0_g2~~TRINITY_DN9540_c0_g2_i6.p2  ORF type:complete len:113 (+),score=10.85 TRINITY_DN9540_c0_g2_i6:516-854(+)